MTKKQFKNEFRYDHGTIETLERGNGFLRARVLIARPGVFPYLTPSGDIRMEAKLPEDIFSEITIDSAKGVPVTDGHPSIDDNKGMVSTANWQKHVKGSLGDSIVIKNDKLEAMETIFDATLIDDLEAGRKVEVSIGFKADIDYTPGEFKGERYDAKQTNIIINHLAHVDKGRAGESVRAYLDSADSKYAVQVNNNKTTRRDSKMDPKGIIEAIKKFLVTIGVKVEEPEKGDVTDPDETGADTGGKDNDPASKTDSAEIKALKKKLQEQRAKIDALDAVNKKQKETQIKADEQTKIDEAVKSRISLIDTAKTVIPDFKYDGLSDREIKLAIIEQTLPYEKTVKIDDLDDVFISARYDAALIFAKEKANITGNTAPASRIDEAAIEKKRAGRLNMMEEK